MVILLLDHDWNSAIIDGIAKIPEEKIENIAKYFTSALIVSQLTQLTRLLKSNFSYGWAILGHPREISNCLIFLP